LILRIVSDGTMDGRVKPSHDGRMSKPKLLMIVSPKWKGLTEATLDNAELVLDGRDAYAPEAIDYVMSFTPPPGKIASLPRLKAAFCLGAGVDGFLSDPTFPRSVPLVRFVDRTLSAEMAQYLLMHVLIHHRRQRFFDGAQRDGRWRQETLPRRTEDTRIGFLGLGEIGRFAATRFADLGFAVSGWSRSRKTIAGLTTFAGEDELAAFLGQSDILICLLSLTRQTRGILAAKTFAALPKGAFVINVARGAHLVETDLIAALDSGQISGAVLDVFNDEPLPAASPLWHHANVTITPHIAAVSQTPVVLRYIRDGIAAFERGETPDTLVTIDTAY
jgi:glyoxylate/hydroxypyruvate reductase